LICGPLYRNIGRIRAGGTKGAEGATLRIKPYRHHVFVCLGKRCGARGSEAILDKIKGRIKSGRLPNVRVSRSGCLKVCRETAPNGEFCPSMIIYPGGVWYRNVTAPDLDEIIKRHIKKKEIVERLLFFKMQD
jgi:(2Fe-2S) ferredoxin